MEYNIQDVDKIIEFTTWNNKQKTDELLRIDCAMYTCLGVDSLKQETEDVRRESKKIYRAIKSINPQLGNTLLNALD